MILPPNKRDWENLDTKNTMENTNILEVQETTKQETATILGNALIPTNQLSNPEREAFMQLAPSVERDILEQESKRRFPTAEKRVDQLKIRWAISKETPVLPPFVALVCRRIDREQWCIFSVILKEIDFWHPRNSWGGMLSSMCGVGPEIALETYRINPNWTYDRIEYQHTYDMALLDCLIDRKVQEYEGNTRGNNIELIYINHCL